MRNSVNFAETEVAQFEDCEVFIEDQILELQVADACLAFMTVINCEHDLLEVASSVVLMKCTVMIDESAQISSWCEFQYHTKLILCQKHLILPDDMCMDKRPVIQDFTFYVLIYLYTPPRVVKYWKNRDV